MRKLFILIVLVAMALPASGAQPGASRLAALPDDGVRMGIATFSSVPTESQQNALTALGLQVQRMKQLPLAIVRGTKGQLLSAVSSGAANDVYPDDRLQYFWDVSNRVIKADSVQALGYTGKGVRVAVVDSGIDATHADLADHVVHNVKIFGPEYANQPDAPGTLVIPIEVAPYNNTDLGSGHGTHVAGIIAADGTTSPSQRGVAPDAELIGYAIGDIALTTAVISAYDHILANPDWGVDVVNNSWGSQFMAYDPNHPINVATKAVADKGVVVVFAAGNSGGGNTEMTLNPFSMPPWVISVAAGTVTKQRSSFSSNGLVMDNSDATAIPVDDPNGVTFNGDRVGFYHPDITAPGSDIVSSCGPTAAYVGPCPPSGTIAASGTSMASPQIAGVAAVLLQANPSLTPQRLRETLEATAVPLADRSSFWQTGYGFVDVTAAISLARRKDPHGKHLAKMHALAQQRVLGDRDWQVVQSTLRTWNAPPATAGGVPDTKTFTFSVPAGTEGVKAVVAYPSAGAAGANSAEYILTVKDADGDVMGSTVLSGSAGASWVMVDLKNSPPAGVSVTFGTWSVTVEGTAAVSDPDTVDNESLLGRTVTLQTATLKSQPRIQPPLPVFTPSGTMSLAFRPDGATPLLTPEGCNQEAGVPEGGLGGATTLECHSGAMGYLLNRLAEVPAVFTSAPLATATAVGGTAKMRVHLVDPPQAVTGVVFVGRLIYSLEEIDAYGTAWAIGTGDAVGIAKDGVNDVTMELPATPVAAGSRLRLKLSYTTSPAGAPTSAARMLYGGSRYGDSGITVTTGTIQ
ncbi:MAG TPA: S8 family serine peptidase [Thermoanaerobaculia bacterium]|nr:S8 family serine peptidase [Thermoanaerobaculia bacterium]